MLGTGTVSCRNVFVLPPEVRVGGRPAIAARDHLHAIGPQPEYPLHLAAVDDGVEIRIPRRLQIGVHRLVQLAARLVRVRSAQQREQRMRGQPLAVLDRHQRHACRRLRDQLHATMHHRIARKPLLRQRRKAPPRPGRITRLPQRHQHLHGLGFGNRRSAAEQAGKQTRHRHLRIAGNKKARQRGGLSS